MSQITVSPVVQALTVSATTQSVTVATVGSSTPVGPAGGDLTGTYPNPTVHRIHGNDMQAGTPSDGDLWQYQASNTRWRHRTWTQCATNAGVTAAGLAILDDADAAAQRTTLGLGTTDSPKFSSISLTNDEFIRNTVNGRIDLMPAPHPSGDFGVYFDLTSSNFYAKVGTIDSAGGLNTNSGFQYDNNLAIVQSKSLDLGNATCYLTAFNTGTGNSVMHIAPYTGSGHSMAVALVSQNANGAANRKPTTAHTNPTFYVYAAGSSNASDFVRLSHDATDGTMEAGRGVMIVTGASGVRINGSFGFGTAPTAVQTGYTTFTNLTTDRTCNANATTVDELADILGTLIEDLKAKGIISA